MIFFENEIVYGCLFEVLDIEDFIILFGKVCVVCKGDDVIIVFFGIGM